MGKIKSFTFNKSNSLSNLIVSIPHSSHNLTEKMKENMKPDVILTNNDWYLKELYYFLNELDISNICANYSRYVIDVNRNIEYMHNHEEYTKSLVYFYTTFNKKIYINKPSEDIIENRIEKIYKPYHEFLNREINNVLKGKNKVYLLDLHSFFEQTEADIVLGTQYKKTCSEEFFNLVYNAFIDEGFTVKVDEAGLRGGYITSHYATIENVEAIQIEIRYTAYIDDRYFGEEFMPKINYGLFNETQERLKKAFKKIREQL